MAFNGLNLFGEKAEAGLLDSDIGTGEGSMTYHSITESMDCFGNFLHSLTEGYGALLESGNLEAVGFEESTKLSKNISKLNGKKKKIEDSISSLKADRKKAESGSKEADSLDKKIEKAEKKLSSIKDKIEKINESAGEDKTIKDLAVLNESLDEIDHEIDELLTESNIHGHVNIPGGTAPHAEIDQRPKSSKTEITADAYNSALGLLQKSFKEMTDIVGALQGAVIVEESTEDKVSKAQDAYLENAIDQAILEAFENGPIFEAVDRSDKKEVKAIVSKIRGTIASKLKEEDVSYYKPNIAARIIMSALPAAVGTIAKVKTPEFINNQMDAGGLAKKTKVNGADITSGVLAGGVSAIQVFWKERLWQILGVCHLEAGNISSVVKTLNEEYKEDLGSYKILAAKTNTTIHDLFKTKFGWKNHKNTYFLLVDKKLPAELKEFQTAVDKAMSSSEGKKEEDAIKECEEYTLDEFSTYIESAFIESMSDDELKELGDDVFAEAAVLYEFFNTAYIAYTEACKKEKVKKKSKDEFVEDGCKACKESADDEFDITVDESPVFEATARKMVKNHTKKVIAEEMNGEGADEAPKKLIRMAANDVARATSKGYRIYAKSCKAVGVKPITKKEFAEKLINEDESFFNEIDKKFGGEKIDAAMDKMEKRVSKKYAKYGLS